MSFSTILCAVLVLISKTKTQCKWYILLKTHNTNAFFPPNICLGASVLAASAKVPSGFKKSAI